VYDALNRCVKRTVNGVVTYYYYDGCNLIEERSGSDVQLARYIHGAKMDEMLKKVTAADSVYYHHDALGNVVQLTNNTGNVVEQYSYGVFGVPTYKDANGNILASSAYGNRFLFTGREYIQEVFLYDYRNRMYSHVLGRFLQLDPLRFDAGDNNMYRYTGNNPVNRLDPLGTIYTADDLVYEGPWDPTELVGACDDLINDDDLVYEGPWDPTELEDVGEFESSLLIGNSFWDDFKMTNNAIWGKLAPPGLGLLLGSGGAISDLLGTATWGQVALSMFESAAGIVQYESLTYLIGSAAITSGVSFLAVGTSYEVGVGLGSAFRQLPNPLMPDLTIGEALDNAIYDIFYR